MEYIISDEKARNNEKIIREFLLIKANFIEFTKFKPFKILFITYWKSVGQTEKFDYPNSKLFYGFEDPIFYDKNGNIIGKVITHENIIFLYISLEENLKKIIF